MKSIPFIIGQTASGKKALTHYAALRTGSEIISVDSMKIYRYMDIGTAKPSPAMRREATYHMIDTADPGEAADVKGYIDQVNTILEGYPRTAYILSGGSSMYIKGIISGIFEGPGKDAEFRDMLRKKADEHGTDLLHDELKKADPKAASKIGRNDLKRIIRALEIHRASGESLSDLQTQFSSRRKDLSFTLIGLRFERSILYERINRRVDRMFEKGLADEVKALYEQYRFGPTSSQAIGYREIIEALEQNRDPDSDEVRDKIRKNTRVFARKQMTWFRKFRDVLWIDADEDQTAEDIFTQIEPLIS